MLVPRTALPRSLLVSFAACWSASVYPAEPSLEAQRQQFALAMNEIAREARAHDASGEEMLRTYPLYPYLQAARMAQALGEAEAAWTPADERARSFLEFYDVEPVGRKLRRAWLKSLARREAWRSFLAEYQSGAADARLRCQYLAGRIAVEDLVALAPAIIEQWLTAERLPMECEPVFQWLRAEGPLTDALIEQRVRLLLQSGETAFARVIAQRLPPDSSAPLVRWAELLEDPATSIDALIQAPNQDIEPSTLLEGWTKLARDDPQGALDRFDALVEGRALDTDQASRYALALALGLSWDRRPEALAIFARVADRHLDDYALEWRSRAALWAGDWGLVASSIGAMSASQRNQARWRYWSGRMAEIARDRESAKRLYGSILTADNYYSALAAARLGRRAAPHPEPVPAQSQRLAEIGAQTAIVRARELWLLRWHEDAIAEWRHGARRLSPESEVQSIHLAASWGWYDLAVATATRHKIFNDYALLYPRPYLDEVRSAGRTHGIDAATVLAVIRQESLYRADAASPAGALGVMQLQLESARRTAREWGLPPPARADLFEPSVSIALGTAHLRSLLERFDGQSIVALAGYNAGAGAADRWLPDQPKDTDIWVENIPFNETRQYVQRVLWHSLVFEWLRSGRAQNTASWLTQVGPSARAESLRVTDP
jgi:soluble lytic murein transglycosylase